MRAAGAVILSTGFLGASWLSAQDATEMSWTPYLAALLLMIAGVVVLRRGSHKATRGEEKVAGDLAAAIASIDRIVEKIEALDASKREMSPYDAFALIDERFADDLGTFAEARESIAHTWGLQTYAAVMNEFAAGERYLNRVWSASVDGYVDEVNEYLGRARDQFLATQRALSSGGAPPP